MFESGERSKSREFDLQNSTRYVLTRMNTHGMTVFRGPCLKLYNGYISVDQLGQVVVGNNISKFTRLASGKSYMVIIGPNSHDDLTKCEIKSRWSRFNHCSKLLCLASLLEDIYGHY